MKRRVATLLLLGALCGCSPAEPDSSGAPAGMRRLTEEQYRNSVADILGTHVQIAGRFDPILRPQHGLIAAGTSQISVSPAGFEQYQIMATSIAAQVVDPAHRGTFLTCTPKEEKAADAACAESFLRQIGGLLFRRPLTDTEARAYVAAADDATRITGDFYGGLSLSLASLLSSPSFIFEIDATEPDPDRPGAQRLNAYAKASRLSFFLWNTTPNAELLAAAARGDLHTTSGLAKQVDRLLASPRLEGAVRTFFADMLQFEVDADLVKDPAIYPLFVRAVKEDMPEQTLRTLVDVTLTKAGDYRDIFTTRDTFMTRPLGVIYGIPVPQKSGWMPYRFTESDNRAGVLTLMNFLAAFSHDGRSSPTLRGKALRELVLCQPVPIPPGDVDFALVQDTKNPLYKTARDRLTAHRANPTCAGCHKIMDPVGLAMENFDGIGVFRADEGEGAIDASGDLDGVAFATAADLGRVIRENPAAPACLVNRMYEYAVRRTPVSGERAWLENLNQRFAADGYRIPKLLRRIALSDAFFKIAPPENTKEAMR